MDSLLYKVELKTRQRLKQSPRHIKKRSIPAFPTSKSSSRSPSLAPPAPLPPSSPPASSLTSLPSSSSHASPPSASSPTSPTSLPLSSPLLPASTSVDNPLTGTPSTADSTGSSKVLLPFVTSYEFSDEEEEGKDSDLGMGMDMEVDIESTSFTSQSPSPPASILPTITKLSSSPPPPLSTSSSTTLLPTTTFDPSKNGTTRITPTRITPIRITPTPTSSLVRSSESIAPTESSPPPILLKPTKAPPPTRSLKRPRIVLSESTPRPRRRSSSRKIKSESSSRRISPISKGSLPQQSESHPPETSAPLPDDTLGPGAEASAEQTHNLIFSAASQGRARRVTEEGPANRSEGDGQTQVVNEPERASGRGRSFERSSRGVLRKGSSSSSRNSSSGKVGRPRGPQVREAGGKAQGEQPLDPVNVDTPFYFELLSRKRVNPRMNPKFAPHNLSRPRIDFDSLYARQVKAPALATPTKAKTKFLEPHASRPPFLFRTLPEDEDYASPLTPAHCLYYGMELAFPLHATLSIRGGISYSNAAGMPMWQKKLYSNVLL